MRILFSKDILRLTYSAHYEVSESIRNFARSFFDFKELTFAAAANCGLGAKCIILAIE